MPKITYSEKSLGSKSLDVIQQANVILEEYGEKGFTLTLRQLYYQFVARGMIENTERDYKRLGVIVNDGRMAGLIDWDHLVDRTRQLRSLTHWESVSEILESCAPEYCLDRWQDQDYAVECWVEKDALLGVVEAACKPLDVPYFSCRGYTSASEMWQAAQRIKDYIESERTPVVLHLGDHDPSGLDMSRDIEERLETFIRTDLGLDSIPLVFHRIALNMEQIRELNPPPNPAKNTDTRFDDYRRKYGDESWELDAIPPERIVSLIEEHVEPFIDRARWSQTAQEEAEGREQLHELAEGHAHA